MTKLDYKNRFKAFCVNPKNRAGIMYQYTTQCNRTQFDIMDDAFLIRITLYELIIWKRKDRPVYINTDDTETRFLISKEEYNELFKYYAEGEKAQKV